MRGLRKFEKRLEKIFQGPFTKLFKGGVQPLEIARRLMREAEDGRIMDLNEILAPDFYLVSLSPADYENLSGYFDRLIPEMEGMIIAYTSEKGYHLIRRPQVRFERAEGLGEGQFEVSTSIDRASREEALKVTPLHPPSDAGTIGVISLLSGENAGSSYYLDKKKTRIGRSEENDLTLPDPRASRFHAEIEREAEGYVLRDLASTNGTLLGGRRIRERLLEDGDTITMGGTEMRFRLGERAESAQPPGPGEKDRQE
jgi:hypothetical protein